MVRLLVRETIRPDPWTKILIKLYYVLQYIHVSQIADNKQKIEVLRKDVETERKRQAAQLRRLQRLVNEAHARRRQWVQETDRLRTNISLIKHRINE